MRLKEAVRFKDDSEIGFLGIMGLVNARGFFATNSLP